MQTKVLNLQGQETGKITLSDEVFGAEYNEALIHQAVVCYLSNQRQGTKSTLTRAEVAGGGKKPWRQKGTGRARQGSIRSPQWIHGGVVFAPKPRDFSKKMNKQARRKALLSALSQKIRQNEVVILDNFAFENAKTKEAKAFIDAFKFQGSILVVNDNNDEKIMKATANLASLEVEKADNLNVYEVVATKNVVLTQSAIKSIKEAYAE